MNTSTGDHIDIDLGQLQSIRKYLQDIVDSPTPYTPQDLVPLLALAFDESDPNFHSSNYRWARQYATEIGVAQAREDQGTYSGSVVYMGQAPVANSLGLEVGFVTDDVATKGVQRTGIGLYLRSDHLWNQRFDSSVERP
jgi:hypothetical protein